MREIAAVVNLGTSVAFYQGFAEYIPAAGAFFLDCEIHPSGFKISDFSTCLNYICPYEKIKHHNFDWIPAFRG